MSKSIIRNLFIACSVLLIIGAYYLVNRFGPSSVVPSNSLSNENLLVPSQVNSMGVCQLSIKNYRQIGNEIQLLLYAEQGGLSPYTIKINQKDTILLLKSVAQRPGEWLHIPSLALQVGDFLVSIQSENDSTCGVSAELNFKSPSLSFIADSTKWFRHGSADGRLDIRVVEKEKQYWLQDFSIDQSSLTKTYFLDGIKIDDLHQPLPIKSGYMHTVTVRWIDAPYNDWWNHLRNRTTRQQIIWINPEQETPNTSLLKKISIPSWFRPSTTFEPNLVHTFPEFAPISHKIVAQYRLQDDESSSDYLSRGVTHLSRWEEDVPFEKQHWTEAPGFFGDNDQKWFENLTKQEVEALANRVTPLDLYAFDFEFWHRSYSPQIRQRLTWFAARLKQNQPNRLLFDYWGGGPYRNLNFQLEGTNPNAFRNDYTQPKSNHHNFERNSDGTSLEDYLHVIPIDVYPPPLHPLINNQHTPNNYLVLSAIHATRINRLLSKNKENKILWYAWNRHMALHDDPAVPFTKKHASFNGDVDFWGLEMMPASQALAMSMFSLFLADGYYLWHDQQAWNTKDTNYDWQYTNRHTWYPTNSRNASLPDLNPSKQENARYADYPSSFFMLGNWMVKQVEPILQNGTVIDLPMKINDRWYIPTRENVIDVATQKLPFVVAIYQQHKIAILAIDSFQAPNEKRTLTIQLPNKQEAILELDGNWPSLYQGTL